MTSRRRRRPTLVLAAAILAGLATVPQGPARADEASQAPVTADDAVVVRGGQLGGFAFVDVLANDSDPDGDELAICRVDVPAGARLYVQRVSESEGGPVPPDAGGPEGASVEHLVIQPQDNRTRTVTFTYYACDRDYLTPATVTVTVRRTPPVTGAKVQGKPGRVRFGNPGDRRVVVLYGGVRQERPDGRVRLAPGASQVVRVQRRTIMFIAFVKRTGEPVSIGRIRDIRLPGDGRNAPMQPVDARGPVGAADLRVWLSAR